MTCWRKGARESKGACCLQGRYAPMWQSCFAGQVCAHWSDLVTVGVTGLPKVCL